MNSKPIPSCQAKEIIVKSSDLPLSCPTPEMELWNGHPKVFLPIEQSKREVCPYCGTHFVLED
jgi:uncharacterized Zn-finger protein